MENNDISIQIDSISLVELFFQKINFSQIRGGTSGEIKLQVKNQFEFQKSNDLQNLKTTIATTISDEIGRLSLDIAFVGIFKVKENVDIKNPAFPQLMVNTMWPYMRSEISLITTQPGISPIILPILSPKVPKEKDDKGLIFA